MSQLKDICNVTNGSPTVTVLGKDITGQITVGDFFSIPGEGVSYQVAGSIAFSTDTTFALSANYAGATGTGLQFVLWRDFSLDDFPLLAAQDLDKALIITQAINLINGRVRKPMVSKTANFTIKKTDLGRVFLVDATAGNITVTVDPAANLLDGFHCTVIKVDVSANTVTLDPDASETLDGAATKVLSAQWARVQIGSDASNLYSIG